MFLKEAIRKFASMRLRQDMLENPFDENDFFWVKVIGYSIRFK